MPSEGNGSESLVKLVGRGSMRARILAGLTALVVISLVGRCLLAADSTSYHVIHGWPELPEKFVFGQVAGVGVDSHNHVFVFHRGLHPLMCFDGNTGKLLTSWGDEIFGTPHGLSVDSQDNIWVTDIKHHLVQKFSNDGKLL